MKIKILHRLSLAAIFIAQFIIFLGCDLSAEPDIESNFFVNNSTDSELSAVPGRYIRSGGSKGIAGGWTNKESEGDLYYEILVFEKWDSELNDGRYTKVSYADGSQSSWQQYDTLSINSVGEYRFVDRYGATYGHNYLVSDNYLVIK